MSDQFAARYIQATGSICDYYGPHRSRDPYLNEVVVALECCTDTLRTLESAWQINQSPPETTVYLIPEHIFARFQDEHTKIATPPSVEPSSEDPISDNHAAYPFRRSTLQRLHCAVFELQWSIISILNALQPGKWERHDLAKPEALIRHINPPKSHSMFKDWFPIPNATIDHCTVYNKRHMGTALWLLKSHSFFQWLSRDNSFLWLHGAAGCGKSVICSTAIQYTFCQWNMMPSMGIAFFYFSSSEESKQGALAMISSLLLQLDKQNRSMDFEHDISLSLYEKFQPDTPPEEELLKCLEAIIQRFQYGAYIFLDGVDENLLGEKQASVLTTVGKMRSWNLPNLHILMTSCNKSDIRISIKPSFHEEVAFESQGANLDIGNYISAQLDNNIELQKWEGYQGTIQQVLTEGSQGIFRYVECQLDELKRCPPTKSYLENYLASLPQNLDEIYERMLCRIDKNHVDHMQRILTLLCFSRRPLLLKEFADAYAIDPQSGHLDLDRRLLDIADIEKSYPGVVRIIHSRDNGDEENREASTICVAHSSLQKYLVSNQILESKAAHFALQNGASQEIMAQICVAYLLQLGKHSDKVKQGMVDGFPFAHYSAKYWFYHCQHTEHVDLHNPEQIMELFKDQGVFESWTSLHDIDRLWESKSSCQPYPAGPLSPIYCASYLGLNWILKKLLNEPGGNKVSAVSPAHGYGGRLGNALQAAAWKGHECIVKVLLDRGVDVNISGDMCGMLMLKYTSIDGTTCGGWCGNALQAASRNGHQGVVQILLDFGADVNAVGGEYETALHAASAHGHVTVVQMLLDWGADINAYDEVFGDPLEVACLRSKEEVVQMLLSRDAQLKDEGGQYGNALEATSRTGSEEMVQLLLDNGADVNAYSGGYCNALSNAAIRGHQRIVEILLDHGADPNAGPFRILGSPLIWAAHGGNEKVVQMLLSRGANVAAPGSSRGNALQAASMKGNEGVVRLLLEHGADVNIRSGDSNTTALQFASRRGHKSVVLALLDSGADVNAPGGQFGTPAEVALKQGYTDIVQILRTAGSKS